MNGRPPLSETWGPQIARQGTHSASHDVSGTSDILQPRNRLAVRWASLDVCPTHLRNSRHQKELLLIKVSEPTETPAPLPLSQTPIFGACSPAGCTFCNYISPGREGRGASRHAFAPTAPLSGGRAPAHPLWHFKVKGTGSLPFVWPQPPSAKDERKTAE